VLSKHENDTINIDYLDETKVEALGTSSG